jgi:hypothetical protein
MHTNLKNSSAQPSERYDIGSDHVSKHDQVVGMHPSLESNSRLKGVAWSGSLWRRRSTLQILTFSDGGRLTLLGTGLAALSSRAYLIIRVMGQGTACLCRSHLQQVGPFAEDGTPLMKPSMKTERAGPDFYRSRPHARPPPSVFRTQLGSEGQGRPVSEPAHRRVRTL